MDVVEIIERLGGTTAAAKRLREKRSTVSMWLVTKRVPLQHVPKVALALDVPASEVWPDLALCRLPAPPRTAARIDVPGQLPMFPEQSDVTDQAA